MSIHTLEKVLYEIASNPANVEEYKYDVDKFLARFALESDEIMLIKDMNVREMVSRNANPMLTMRAFGALEGRANMPEYLRRLNQPAT